jgi:hypothetical protein
MSRKSQNKELNEKIMYSLASAVSNLDAAIGCLEVSNGKNKVYDLKMQILFFINHYKNAYIYGIPDEDDE